MLMLVAWCEQLLCLSVVGCVCGLGSWQVHLWSPLLDLGLEQMSNK